MEYATLASGQRFPLLGLGTWKSPAEELYQAIRKAIEIGYRHIDCAAIYGNEATVGKALNDAIQNGEVTREELWITSKLWNSDHDPDHVEAACRKTLEDLQLDYLDLYLMHWPIAQKHSVGYSIPGQGEDFIPLSELPVTTTWQAMEKLVESGLTQSIGVSNFSIKKLEDLINQVEIKPVVNQVESHPYLAQNELLEFCRNHNIVLTAYAPLGSKDRPEVLKGKDEPSLLENPVITKIAETHQATPAQILIAWQLTRGVATIPKSVNPARLQQNFDSLNVELTAEDLATINELDKHYRFIDGSIFTIEGSTYTQDSLWD